MCGIVGYLGDKNPKDVIINGLKKLEYRGYDSAGVAILNSGAFKLVRASGKLKELENKLVNEKFNGQVGIGHTRWATHGPPVEKNAHPHQAGDICLVHNGIIENYLEIREDLINMGVQILSDTDSELVAHLIDHEVQKTQNLLKAVQNVLEKLRGAYSILAVWNKEPENLVAFKSGPPLIIGVGQNENFIASDVQAVIQHTNKIIYLDDYEIAWVNRKEVKVFSVNGYQINKKIVSIDWSPEMVEKQGFSHFMLKEIYEQPRAIASAIEPHINRETFEVKLNQLGVEAKQLFDNVERVMIIACGTSYYAGQVGKYLIENLSQISVETDIASEFRYRNPVLNSKTLVITISQSGETADTLAAIRLAKDKGAKTLSICNVKNSTIDREAFAHLYMNAGPEIGVASTKAFVCTLSILNLVAIEIAKVKKVLKPEIEKQIIQDFLALPSQLEVVLAYDKYFAEAAHELKKYKGFLYMGRGVSFPIAMEGALKLKELAYMHAEGYAAGEMKHGPLALIDDRMAIVMVVPQDEHYEKTVSNLEEARARGGQIISIGTSEDKKLKSLSLRYLAIPKTHSFLTPILSVVPLQLMAFHLASELGFDVDQPRNLAKSVTVE